MKHPPLIQALFAVMILGVINVQMKGTALSELPMRQLVVLAAALVGLGMMVSALVEAGRPEEAPPADAPPRRQDDDLDLSA